jgi:hypothetical protein
MVNLKELQCHWRIRIMKVFYRMSHTYPAKSLHVVEGRGVYKVSEGKT